MTEREWLDEDEGQTWRAVVKLLIELTGRFESQLQRDAGISHYSYGIMAVLSDAPDRSLTMSELARLTNGSLSRLSHAIKTIEKRQWVTRHPDPNDGRITLATLTPAGAKKLSEIAPGHVAEVRTVLFDRLTRQQQHELRALANLLTDDEEWTLNPTTNNQGERNR